MPRTPSALPLALAMAMPICAGCPGGEEPALATVPVQIATARDGVFTTDLGYEIVLGMGILVLGDMQFHTPTSEEVALGPAPAFRWLTGPAVAHAHPGHDMAGDVRGEWAGTTYVDLLSEPREVGEATFYEGTYATASLSLHQDGVDGDAGMPFGHPAEGRTVVLEGTASDFDLHVPFALLIDHSKTVAGIPFEVDVDALDPPSLTLRVDPARILAHLDFADLYAGTGNLTMDDEEVANRVLFGLESNLSYSFENE